MNKTSSTEHFIFTTASDVSSTSAAIVTTMVNNLTTSLMSTSLPATMTPQSVTNSNISDLVTNSTTEESIMFNSTVGNFTMDPTHEEEKNIYFTKLLMGLLITGFACVLIILGLIFIRKKKLDKLRLHLMPVYNFDPSEDGEDWETGMLIKDLIFKNNQNKLQFAFFSRAIRRAVW